MTEQQKILRVLRLIGILADKPYRNVKQLSVLLETTERTVYRYLELLEEIGYHVDKDEENRYFIFESEPVSGSTFEQEEMQLLHQLLDTLILENPLRESLKRKLYLTSYLVPLADELAEIHVSKIVQRLASAINDHNQVKLKRYQSPSSEVPQDRQVEPIGFVKNNSQLIAFDVEKQAIRHFKVKRIEDVEILSIPCSSSYTAFTTDIFGFPSDEVYMVKLALSKRAYQLLIEEFPEAKRFCSPMHGNQAKPYRFVYEARSLIGVGRFILGLPGEILIESPYELKEYLKKRIAEFGLTEVVNEAV